MSLFTHIFTSFCQILNKIVNKNKICPRPAVPASVLPGGSCKLRHRLLPFWVIFSLIITVKVHFSQSETKLKVMRLFWFMKLFWVEVEEVEVEVEVGVSTGNDKNINTEQISWKLPQLLFKNTLTSFHTLTLLKKRLPRFFFIYN